MALDFNKILQDSLDQYQNGFVKLFIFFVAGTFLTLTIILIPCVFGGLARGFLGYIREGKDPEFSELWSFDNYIQITLFIIVYTIAIVIGFLLFFFPGFFVIAWYMYGIYYIVDRDMSFTSAMSASKKAVKETGVWHNLGIDAILGACSSIGSSFFGIGAWILTPFAILCKANSYILVSGNDVSGNTVYEEMMVVGQPPPPPPSSIPPKGPSIPKP